MNTIVNFRRAPFAVVAALVCARRRFMTLRFAYLLLGERDA